MLWSDYLSREGALSDEAANDTIETDSEKSDQESDLRIDSIIMKIPMDNMFNIFINKQLEGSTFSLKNLTQPTNTQNFRVPINIYLPSVWVLSLKILKSVQINIFPSDSENSIEPQPRKMGQFPIFPPPGKMKIMSLVLNQATSLTAQSNVAFQRVKTKNLKTSC